MGPVRAALVPLVFAVSLSAGDGSCNGGKVVGVQDGDTLTVLCDARENRRIRLAGIDAPEKGQPYYRRARQFLSRMAFGQQVRLRVRERDRYGRLVAEVILPGGQSLNRMAVAEGYAWWYRRYAAADRPLARWEESARTARKGLWAEDGAIPPWLWRKQQRTVRDNRSQ